MKTYSFSFLLILLSWAHCVAVEDSTVVKGALTPSVEYSMPAFNPNVSFTHSSDVAGMRVYWNAEEGRRDLGQQFHVETPFKASRLALKITAATPYSEFSAPFRLTFTHSHSDTPEPGSVVAIYEGNIFDTHGELTSGMWLILEFPELDLPVGDYSFLLQFIDPGAGGRTVIFSVARGMNAYSGGRGLQSDSLDEPAFRYGHPIEFILTDSVPVSVILQEPRELLVDQRGGADYQTIAEAVSDCRPGDTVRLASGSGPYREPLFIRQSGEPDAPIIFDGNGEVVTGFEPLTGFYQDEGRYVCDLSAEFPFVLTYQGERLIQSVETGQFMEYATLSEDHSRLVLEPTVETTGWEISSRTFVVRVENVSHHTYRNVHATGALNDGFNLHGTGDHLLFENIAAYHNLDEGFSAHDAIRCEIRKATFSGNDNGLGNVGRSSMVASQLKLYSNLGWGLWLSNCSAQLDQVEIRDNGVAQVIFTNAEVHCLGQGITSYAPTWEDRPWVSYKESANQTATKSALYADSHTRLTGVSPRLLESNE